MSATMRAVVISAPGGIEVLELRDVPRPAPSFAQVLVRVHAAALNRADIMQRQGRYPPPADSPADIPGMELAGEIAEVGPGVARWKVGQRVFGIVGGGAYAEYVVTHERLLAEIPDSLGYVDAAAIPEAFITANDALVEQASMRASELVLIHACASGVGLAAIQLTRALGGVPFGTARGAGKLDRAREYGLEDGWDASGDLGQLAARARDWSGGRGVNIVLDLVGGAYVAASLAALAPRGRLILIGTIAGAEATIPLGRVLSSRLTIRGTVLRNRPLEEKILATRAFETQVVPLYARGVMRATIDREYPIASVRDAHARLESNATVGKIVLLVS
ncbi:MAG TPA: NAD(P)H-quinone oxidoreductase [Gemmatimonadaceae bacterium]|nr:NAD(P)H-quinone oxidoreductase [Gemmatimonadaceae bacterium]